MPLLVPLADALGAGRPLRRIPLTALHGLAGVTGALAVGERAGAASGRITDRLWAAVFVAFVSLCCAHARRWPWVLATGIATATATGPMQWIAGIALAWAVMAATSRTRRSRHVGAVVGGIAGVALLTGDAFGPGAQVGLAGLVAACAAASAYRTTPRAGRVLPRRLAIASFLLLLAALGGYAIAAQSARDHAIAGVNGLDDGLDAAERRDTDSATIELRRAAGELRLARDELAAPWARPAQFLPFVGTNARAIDQLASSGAALAATAADAVDEIDIDRLGLDAGRIDLDLARQVADGSTRVADEIDRALVRLGERRTTWLLAPIDDQVVEAITLLRDAQPTVQNLRDAARAAPRVLGEGATRRYLVLFTTPVESRAMIGFPGNFAELEATSGGISLVKFGRVASDLQSRGLPLAERTLSGPEEYLARYGRFSPAQTWPNITLSPDFPTVAQVAAELYPQSGGRKVDGVLQADPTALAALLRLTGPVPVPGLATPISADNAVSFLNREQYVAFRGAQRVDMLETIGLATFQRLTEGDLPALDEVADVLAPVVAGGHLRFSSFDPEVAPVLRRAGIDGAFPAVAGDSLAVLTANDRSNKLDAFIERSTTYDVDWDPATGAFTGRLTVAFTNNAPVATLPDYVLGVTLPVRPGAPASPARGTHRMSVSLYTPWLPAAASVDDRTVGLQIERELGRYVATATVEVPAGRTVVLSSTWQGRLEPAQVYLLDLIHQPQANPERVKVQVRTPTATPLQSDVGTAQPGAVVLEQSPDRNIRLVVTPTTP